MELVLADIPYFLDKNYHPPHLPNQYLALFSAPLTRRCYAYALWHWLQYCEDRGLDWSTATQDTVKAYRAITTGANGTRNYRIGRIKAFYYWCEPHGIHNPFQQLARQRRLIYFPVVEKEVRPVPMSDVARFLRVLSTRDRLIAKVMLYCGLRRSEVLSLTRAMVMSRSTEGVSFTVRGKGEKERTLWMPAILHRELLQWAVKQPPSVWLFHRNGKPLHPDTIGAAFKKAQVASSVGVHPHMLRHIFATTRLEQEERARGGLKGLNAALKVVQIELGHASLKTTSRYLHMLHPNEVGSYYGRHVQAITDALMAGGDV